MFGRNHPYLQRKRVCVERQFDQLLLHSLELFLRPSSQKHSAAKPRRTSLQACMTNQIGGEANYHAGKYIEEGKRFARSVSKLKCLHKEAIACACDSKNLSVRKQPIQNLKHSWSMRCYALCTKHARTQMHVEVEGLNLLHHSTSSHAGKEAHCVRLDIQHQRHPSLCA